MSSAVATLKPTARVPLIASQYDKAIAAVIAVQTVEEGRHQFEKAAAIAAWARIHHHDELLKQAKKLKLHAFRRLHELTEELGAEGQRILRDAGFNDGERNKIRAVGRASEPKFAAAVQSDNPPSPLAFLEQEKTPDGALKSLRSLQYFSTRVGVSDALASVSPAVRAHLNDTLCGLIDWLREMERQLRSGR